MRAPARPTPPAACSSPPSATTPDAGPAPEPAASSTTSGAKKPAPAAYDPRRTPAGYAAEGLHVSRCWECDDGYRQLPYQEFKRQHVATWGSEWRISRTEILTWLAEHHDKQASHDPGHDEPPPPGPHLEAGQ